MPRWTSLNTDIESITLSNVPLSGVVLFMVECTDLFFLYMDRYTFRVKPMHASLSGDSLRLSFARVLDRNAG